MKTTSGNPVIALFLIMAFFSQLYRPPLAPAPSSLEQAARDILKKELEFLKLNTYLRYETTRTSK